MADTLSDTLPQPHQIIIQVVTHQRGEAPNGLRVLADGAVQQPPPNAPENAAPAPTARLDHDRPLVWQTLKTLDADALNAVIMAVRAANFAALPTQMLINYCKEDPGTAIWQAAIDGETYRVVVWDPRPRRSAALDTLMAALAQICGLMP